MNRYHLAWPIAVCSAALASWVIGGTAGVGIAVGFASGAAASAAGLFWQSRAWRTRPEHALLANVASFLASFVLLGAGGLAIRALDPHAHAVDWRTFLIGFAAAVALVPPIALIHITGNPRNPGRVRAP